MMLRGVIFLGLFLMNNFLQGLSISWPTHDSPIANNAKWTIDNYIQPTESGKLESGKFGFVRENGTRYHEGIDIKSFQKEKNGNPMDTVCAFMDGKVVYVNTSESASSYGRYVVLEHEYFSTLYAHLASIDATIGKTVKAGDKIGILGTSSNCVKIPNIRAHLHFEIDFQIGDGKSFAAWYAKNFNDKNAHGEYNGLNLIGIDPIANIEKLIKGVSPTRILCDEKEAATVQIASNYIPEFVKKYAALFAPNVDLSKPFKGWKIQFSWFGLPIAWVPIYDTPTTPDLKLVSYRKSLLDKATRRDVLKKNQSPKGACEITAGTRIINVLQKMGFDLH
jgi:murein DD-endopeptidase MepM/ murein hydrolase activator NlpD